MLDRMRAAANTWVAKALLGLLLLSLTLWGIPQAFYSQRSNTIYQSGKSSVSLEDYQFSVQNEAARYYVMTRQYISPNQFVQLGLAQEILQRLNANVLLDEEARHMKINIGEKGKLRILGQDPIFHGANGNLDKNAFQSFIQQAQIKQNTYFDQLGKTGIRNQIMTSINDNLSMPDVFLSAVVLNNSETRSIDYITVTPNLIGTIDNPSADVLATWYESNKANFRAPEYRKATYVTLTTSSLTKPSAISDEEIKQAYQNEMAKFSKPETRTLETLFFTNRQAANEAEQKLKNGMSFEELAASLKQNLDEIRTESVAKTDVSLLTGSQIFALKEGSVSSVLSDLQGSTIVRVTKITPAVTTPFDKASEQIRQELALNKANQDLSNLVKIINDEQDEGFSLNEIAQKHNLPIQTVTIDNKGKDLLDKEVEVAINKQNLIEGIFKATVGINNNPLNSDDGVQWYQAEDIIAARDRNLDEVQAKAIATWKKQETDRLVTQKAQEFKVELDKGKSLTQIAQENNIDVHQATGLTRVSKNDALSVNAIRAIFIGPNGSTGIEAANDQQSKLVFKVSNTAEPINTSANLLDNETKRQLELSLRQDVFFQYLLALEAEHPIQTNATNIQNIFKQ